jgi:hypothetical protein
MKLNLSFTYNINNIEDYVIGINLDAYSATVWSTIFTSFRLYLVKYSFMEYNIAL